jgi:hypothetical protein
MFRNRPEPEDLAGVLEGAKIAPAADDFKERAAGPSAPRKQAKSYIASLTPHFREMPGDERGGWRLRRLQ